MSYSDIILCTTEKKKKNLRKEKPKSSNTILTIENIALYLFNTKKSLYKGVFIQERKKYTWYEC